MKSLNLKLNGADSSHNKKTENLYVLPGFEKILNNSSFKAPFEKYAEDNDIDKPSNYNSVDGIEHQKSIDKYQQLASIDFTSEPFHIWVYKGKKYIVDGRIDEYKLGLENGIEIQTIEHNFKSISEARMFMILHLLKKPNFNNPQRTLLALQFEKDIAKRAAKNRGRKSKFSDESSKKIKKLHTVKELARLANVGEQYIKQFRRILKDGPDYFGKEETEEYVSQIIREQASANAIHRKLTDKIAKEKEKEKFAKNHKDELLTSDETEDAETTDEPEKDEHEDAPIEPVYINPDYEKDFHNKIVCESNIEAFKKIPNNSVNLIFGSPPYNVPRVNYDISVPLVSHKEHIQHLVDVAKECYRIARDGGRFVINIAPTRGLDGDDILETFIVSDIVSAFEKHNIGWKKRNVIIWNKRCSFQRSPKGKASASNPCFNANHEYLIVFSKGSWESTPEIPDAPSDLAKYEYRKWAQSVWNIVPQSKGKGDHPCPFPEPLVERVIKMLSFVGDTVVEPWLGSGSTTAVAARLSRRWFGCDISPKYCLHSAERTAKAHKEFIEQAKSTEETANVAA